MAIVDVHVHIYPDKVAAKAAESVGDFYHIEMEEPDGSVGRYLSIMDSCPITHAVVHSVAVKPKTVTSINDFIAQTCKDHPELFGFMTMHQDFEDPAAEIERACGMGLLGIKLHPDTQKVNLDDPRLMAVYEIAEKKGLPVIFHTGDYRYDYSHPRRLKHVLDTFPNLTVNAAHFGGWSVYDLAVEYLEHERCFLDVSSSMRYLGQRRVRELVDIYGCDRILFGSDFPMWHSPQELEIFCANTFSDAELERMCWHNTESFLSKDIGR